VIPPVAALLALLGVPVIFAADSGVPPTDVFQFITQGGAIAVFALVFWALLSGRLWIGKTVDQALRTKDEQIAYERDARAKVETDRDYWRDMNMSTMRPLAERAFALAEAAAARPHQGRQIGAGDAS
jgi:hypothetical protein